MDYKKLIDGIVENTFPEMHLGVQMNPDYGMRLVFDKKEGKLIFQCAPKFHLVQAIDDKRLFNFITATEFEIYKTIEDEGFYELIYSLILSAIGDFNRYIKANTSYLTRDRSYPDNIPFEEQKEVIRKAWTHYQFNARSSSN